MVSFVALYRGETAETAEIIAVSTAPEIVSGFVRGLADEGGVADSEYPKPASTMIRDQGGWDA